MQLRISWYIVTCSCLPNHALWKRFKLLVILKMTQVSRRLRCIRPFLITVRTLDRIRIIFICHWNFHFFLLLCRLNKMIVSIILYHMKLLFLLYRSVQDLNFRSNRRWDTMHFWIDRRWCNNSLDSRFLGGSFLLDKAKKFGTFHFFLVHRILRSVFIRSINR